MLNISLKSEFSCKGSSYVILFAQSSLHGELLSVDLWSRPTSLIAGLLVYLDVLQVTTSCLIVFINEKYASLVGTREIWVRGVVLLVISSIGLL